VPLPESGELRITDVTHSTMQLDWDASPGAVRKYIITYKPDEGEAKEVRQTHTCKLTKLAVLTLKKKPFTRFVIKCRA